MKDAFLDALTGEWTLSGQMGSVALQQSVLASWVLNESFVEMRFMQTDLEPGKDPYEAIYLIGFDAKAGGYVFHLFDTFGVTADYKFATGKRSGDVVVFSFPYSAGTFYNTLERHEDGAWTWLLESTENGARKPFAMKRMTRWPED